MRGRRSCSPRSPRPSPDQADIARKALSEAIGAGDMPLALVARARGPRGQAAGRRAAAAGDRGDQAPASGAGGAVARARAVAAATSGFLAPLISAWTAADRGDQQQALAALDQIPARSLLAPVEAEQRALHPAEVPANRRGRAARPPGRRPRRSARNPASAGVRRRFPRRRRQAAGADDRRGNGRGRSRGAAADRGRQECRPGDRQPARGSERGADAFAGDLIRLQPGSPPIGLVQVARYANPQNSSATALARAAARRAGSRRRSAGAASCRSRRTTR